MTRRRAVLYLRLSEQDDASTGIARQEADLRAHYDAEGAEVIAVLVDDGLSGRRSRAKADEALRMVRDGEADDLGVWKFDRWSRQGIGVLGELIEALDARPSAGVMFLRDGLHSGQPAWRIIAGVLAEVARMEAENTSMRVTSSINTLRRTGRFAGGTVPYGYVPAPRPDGPGRVLVVDPVEAAVVRRAAEMIRSTPTTPLYRICMELNADAVPAPRSEHRRLVREGKDAKDADRGAWRVQSLRRLMTSDHLAGRVVHQGTLLRGSDGLPETVWEPILSPSTLTAIRALLEPSSGTRVPNAGRRAARLLSGLTFCAECGSKMYVRSSGGRPLYGCPSGQNGVPCSTPRVTAVGLESHIESLALDVIGEQRVTRTVAVDDAADAAALAEIEEAIRETTTSLQDDDADIAGLMTRLQALKERRASLRQGGGSQRRLYVVEDTGQSWAEAYGVADVAVRRSMLSEHILSVRVSPTTSRANRLDKSRVEVVWAAE